jgi:hypothetical protein
MFSHFFFDIFPFFLFLPNNWEWWCSDVSHYFDRYVYRVFQNNFTTLHFQLSVMQIVFRPLWRTFFNLLSLFWKKKSRFIHLSVSLCSSVSLPPSVYSSIQEPFHTTLLSVCLHPKFFVFYAVLVILKNWVISSSWKFLLISVIKEA